MAARLSSCDEHPRYVKGCEACRQRSRDYSYQRRWAVYGNTWDAVVVGDELERVCQHVRGLLELPGVTVKGITTVSGIGSAHIYSMLKGKRRKVHRTTAEALLGVTPQRALPVATGLLDSIGAARMLQALACEGWDSPSLSALSGFHRVTLDRWRRGFWPGIHPRYHQRLVQLYRKILGLPDPSGPSESTRRWAQRAGFVPPEGWADGDIDNPDAEPLPPLPDTDDHVAVSKLVDDALRHPAPGKAAGYERHIKREIARQALGSQLGWTHERVAELLGFSSANSVEYLLNGRKDRPHTRQGD